MSWLGDVEGESALFRDASEDDTHDIREGQTEGTEDDGGLFFDVGADSGADYGVFYHGLLQPNRATRLTWCFQSFPKEGAQTLLLWAASTLI